MLLLLTGWLAAPDVRRGSIEEPFGTVIAIGVGAPMDVDGGFRSGQGDEGLPRDDSETRQTDAAVGVVWYSPDIELDPELSDEDRPSAAGLESPVDRSDAIDWTVATDRIWKPDGCRRYVHPHGYGINSVVLARGIFSIARCGCPSCEYQCRTPEFRFKLIWALSVYRPALPSGR